jgi:membrane protein
MAEQKVTKNTRQSPWKLAGLGPKELGKRVATEFNDDNVLDGAAMLAYYFFFALFPMLIFLMSMLGIVGGQGIGNNVVDQITRIMPSSASTIVHETMKQALQASNGAKLSFGILITLWSAAAGMTGLMAALNNVFEVRETRSFIKSKSIALGLTIGNSLIVLVGIVLLLYGGNIADHFLAGHLNIVWKVIQYPVAIFFLLLSYSTIYYFAPNIEHPHWAWVTPGSVIGVALWVIASVGLRVYLHFSNSYNATYGAIGGVMILMLWFYVTGLAVLIGGEVNSEIEKAAGANQKRAAARQEHSRRPAA